MKLILYCFVVSLMSSSVFGLSCIPCDEAVCTEPTGCKGGIVKGVCGCCDVCAKVLNETCGGPWGIGGTCDEGLTCYIDPRLHDIDLFNANGKCVDETPPTPEPCGTNETFTAFGPPCEPDCENRDADGCAVSAFEPKCVCDTGTIRRSTENRTCVPAEECPPPVCEFPEVLSECASPCAPSCDNRRPFCIEICQINRCVCSEGFVRASSSNKTCIRESECPVELCDSPKVFSECGGACHATCDNLLPICPLVCTGGCVCPEGMVQRSLEDSTCVPRDECPPRCEFPKVFQECASACQPTCDVPSPTICTRDCILNQCVCPDGWVLRSLTNATCIKPDACKEAETCEISECPAVTTSTCTSGALKAWVCEMENWGCSSYKWKREMESWMLETGCSFLSENPWDEAFQCGHEETECTNSSARAIVFDAFGCSFTKCTDGKYKDPKALFAIWQRFAKNHQARMMSYQRAKEFCSCT